MSKKKIKDKSVDEYAQAILKGNNTDGAEFYRARIKTLETAATKMIYSIGALEAAMEKVIGIIDPGLEDQG